MTSTQNNQRDDNSVHLEGVINACVISGEKEGVVTAMMKLCTKKVETNNDGETKTTMIFHRVMVNSKDKELLTGIRDACAENLKNRENGEKNPIFVAVDGSISHSDALQGNFIMVKGDNIRKLDYMNISNNNIASIKGQIKQVTYTDKAAKIMVEIKDAESKKITIPVMVSRKDNPAVWDAIAEQKIDKNTSIVSKGPIINEKYDKDDPKNFIKVLGNFIKIEQKLKKTERKATAPAL